VGRSWAEVTVLLLLGTPLVHANGANLWKVSAANPRGSDEREIKPGYKHTSIRAYFLGSVSLAYWFNR